LTKIRLAISAGFQRMLAIAQANNVPDGALASFGLGMFIKMPLPIRKASNFRQSTQPVVSAAGSM
jgi:hypothetical protein